jgi:stress response protein YsnF
MGNLLIVYDIERTICDILRSRSRIDSQTLAAAMKNYIVRKEQDWNKLRMYSEAFHITKLLRQYLEVLT